MISGTDSHEKTGYVFDIQGLSVHDGPGCRTLIFLNGCTLNCFWCSNPEGMNVKPSFMWFSSKCIGCGNCLKLCPDHAIQFEHEKPLINRQICLTCDLHECLQECYSGAIRLSGKEMSVTEIFSLIQRDRNYWGTGGGLTLTGGEPLLQIDFAEEILQRCHNAYIHTAIETCGNIPWSSLRKVIPFLDWIFFDLKHFDGSEHQKATNSDNDRILENARLLSEQFTGRLIFRLPLVPGFNDSEENITSLIQFLKEIGRLEINILPLHHLGREKYQSLGKEYHGVQFLTPDIQDMRKIESVLTDAGIRCYIGGETPF